LAERPYIVTLSGYQSTVFNTLVHRASDPG